MYDDIGRSYARTRREDVRIAAEIFAGLWPGRSLLNVGAGTGNYEPPDRFVMAVEPSLEMLRQRHGRSHCVVRGVAEALPFPDSSFEVAMAILTVHHWSNPAGGLAEMRRVARRQVVLYFEPLRTHEFWGLEYFPEAVDLATEQSAPGAELIGGVLDVREIRPVLVPWDCVDGFGTAFWRRPEAYLDPEVQAGMSWLALLAEPVRRRGTERLAADLASGAWDQRHAHLRRQATFDGGYRIAVAD